MKKVFLNCMLLLCALIVGSISVWATDFDETYSYGDNTWSKSNFSFEFTYYKSSSSSDCVASIAGIFTDKTITSDVVITLDVACYGNGSNPTSAKFKIYTSSACSTEVTASQSGTLPNNSTYTSPVYTITKANALAKFSDDLAIKVASGTKLIRFRSFRVQFSYTPAVTKKNTTLSLTPNPLNLSYGGSTGTLTATVTPEGESALASPTITWKSSDESVATVSGGVVSPVGEGSATITATYAGDANNNGSSNTATVNVSDSRIAVVEITKICSQKTLYIGGAIAFEPDVTLADGLSASDVEYTYVSADPTTIQINDGGTYTVLKTGTNIDITVTASPIPAKSAIYKPISATFQHNGAYRYSKPTFTPTGVTDGNFTGSMTLEMTNDGTPTGPIYYTTDGTEPATDKSNCTLYESALNFTATTTVKARVIDANGLYSTVQSATYTRVPAQKDAITLAAGQSLSFTNFSGLGDYGTDKETYVLSSDGDKYKWTSTNVGYYSSAMQIKDAAGAYTTSSPVTSTNGFKMTVTTTQNSVKVYVGSTEKTAVDGAYYFSSGDAVTLKRNGGTTKVSNITFTGLKPSRSVTFSDGNQTITVGGSTITKTATVSPAGTATYSSSNTAVATVNPTTGEVTAVKGGAAVITATVAADENYEKSTGSYTVTVNKGATTLAFAHAEETVELVDGTATFTATISPADGRSITYSSDDVTVNSSTGAVTLTATGDFTIKANATATDKYLAPSEASYTLHVVDNRVPVVDAASVNLTLENVVDLNNVAKDNSGDINATYTKAIGFEGTEVVTIESSNPEVFFIDNGEYLALKGGTVTVTVTITSNGDKMFTTVEKNFTVTVINSSKTATEIIVADAESLYEDGDEVNLTYGTPIELEVDITSGYEGTIGAEFENDQIAELSVSGTSYTITPLAVGSTTFTLSAGETANYAAAANISLTINVVAPSAQTSTPLTDDYYFAVQEAITKESNFPQGWTANTTAWEYSSDYGAVTKTTLTSGTYDLVTEDYDLSRYKEIGIDFDHTGKTFSSPSSACNVYVQEGSETPKKLTIGTYFSGSNFTWKNSGDITIGDEYDGKTVHFIFRFTPTSGNGGKWEVKNFNVWGKTYPSIDVTLNADGYATFCSEYPLDFSDYETANYSAWQITDVSNSTITFSQITGTIKGGKGILLKGPAGEDITINTAESGTEELSSNMLVGCMVPTYLVRSDLNYVLVHNEDHSEFQKLDNFDVTIPANKAYLHLPAALAGAPDRMRIVFEENNATDINSIEASDKAVKFIENGQLFIKKNGVVYDAVGRVIRR